MHPRRPDLVEALLARDGPGDLEAAQRAVDRLAAVPTEPGFVLQIPLLRLRALLARAHADEAGYQRFLHGFGTRAQHSHSGEDDQPTIMSVYGPTGATAYFGMTDISKPKEGETVVVPKPVPPKPSGLPRNPPQNIVLFRSKNQPN